MKAEFPLTLFDDDRTKRKLGSMSKLEVMFDDARNTLPPEFFWFSDEVPMGSTIMVTLELVCAPKDESQEEEPQESLDGKQCPYCGLLRRTIDKDGNTIMEHAYYCRGKLKKIHGMRV
jgi:hypothetical protein